MRRAVALVALALSTLEPGPARADEPAPAAPHPASPARPVPDYDGRGPPPPAPGEGALWIPRVVLSPVYLVTEYVLRRPLAVIIPAAERIELPRKLYDFFTFGPEHKAGIAPVGFVEFNFNPSVGVYAFWDDAGFKGDHLQLHAEAWPDDWLAGSLKQRIDLDARRALSLRIAGTRRPDHTFYGLGPGSLQSSQSRYGIQRVDGSVAYEWSFWRSSQIQTALGARDVSVYDGSYGGDPSLTQEAASGAFPVPYGFGREYAGEYHRVLVALDTRVPASRLGTGVRAEVAAEQGSDLRSTPASGWMRYGGTLAGYVDLSGHDRVLGLSVTTLFTDPLGNQPVPFTELAYLGGDHPMAAYFEGRLVDRSAAAATASYSWPIGPWLDGHLQLAAGNAFGAHLSGLEPRLLRLSGALGISVAGLQNAPIEFLLGAGTETFDHGGQIDAVRVMFGVPHTF